MKPLFVIILFFSFAAQSFGSVWLFVDYKINLEKYAEKCINKARPMMQCKGKCQLAKKIQEEENQKKQEAAKGTPKIDYTLSSKNFFPALSTLNINSADHFSLPLFEEEVKMPRFLFRPPCC